MTRPVLAIIAAVAENRTIGKDGTMPWHIPGDLAYFKQTTQGHPIVMGRKTWDSLGRPLPGRRNIVVTRNRELQLAGAETAASLEEALAMCQPKELVFCIGGAMLYEEALPLAEYLYLTEIREAIEGDTWFPEYDRAEWNLLQSRPDRQRTSPRRFDFAVYSRRVAS